MKHWKWLLNKIHSGIDKNVFVRVVSRCFIFNLIKAAIIIFLLILLLFQVKPRNAYIYAELEQINYYSLQAQAKHLTVNDISGEYMFIWSEDRIVIKLDGLSINDVDYSDREYLVIYPEDQSDTTDKKLSAIAFSGTKDSAGFYNTTSFSYNCVKSESYSYTFTGEEWLRIAFGTAYVVDANGDKREFDQTRKLVITNTSHKNNDKLFSQSYSNEHRPEIKVFAEPTDSRSKNAQIETHFEKFKNIKAESASSYKVEGDGKLTISYTPTPEEYSFKKQELFLLSDESSLNIYLDVETGEASIWGYADEATLSLMNLFPSFWNWYFSNIYMAPLTLISTVFAAVSMMNVSKKK